MVKQGDIVRSKNAGLFSPVMRVSNVHWLASTPDESTITCEWMEPDGVHKVWYCGPRDIESVGSFSPPDARFELDDIVYFRRGGLPTTPFRIVEIVTYVDPLRRVMRCQHPLGDTVMLNEEDLMFAHRPKSAAPMTPDRGFAIGDTVRLKSGGPKMTVAREDAGKTYGCTFFHAGDCRAITLHEATLESA